ncbi:MAG: glycosyl hydrolase, partial [Edaphobacter sp.]
RVTADFTNGPRWPIAMPGVKSADDPAALYEMTYGSKVIQPGQTYVGVVPARRKIHTEGASKLDAILAYRMTGHKVLDPSSLIDLTTKAHIDPADNAKSTVEFTAPSGSDPWVLFTFWEQPAVQKVDGYYVIDHFSAAGAKASNDYWEKVAFPALGANIKYVHSIFNDSLEYAVTMEWTRGMQDFFKQQHGYDITPYLPFIGMASTFPANDIPGFKTADLDLAEKVQHDFRETLTSLYVKNHLEPMEQMAERHGMTVRYQVAYNKPMQIEDSALAVGIPETEALGRSSIDMARYMAGAVHLAGKPFYSIETSAEFGNQYGQSLEDLLWWNKRAWAGGVNIQRLHGESYSGEFDGPGSVNGQLQGQAWPGYSAFGLGVSNNWIRQTSPEALHQTLTYMARVNYIMQKTAKVDVAVYDDAPDIYDDRSTTTHGDGNAVYRDAGILNANGFSYDFVSPAMLDLAQATLTNGRVGKEGPAYKALIVPPRYCHGDAHRRAAKGIS